MPLQHAKKEPQPPGTTETRVTVVGGGLVGCMQALFLAKRGYRVDLYEKRPDDRTPVPTTTITTSSTQQLSHKSKSRSINMTLSERGRVALRKLGLEEAVLKSAMPVQGRMIHSKSGEVFSTPYSINGDCIYSLDRQTLNKLLLDQAETNPNITLHFSHELVGADLPRRHLTFSHTSTEAVDTTTPGGGGGGESSTEILQVETDFVFGCDGVFSSVRQCMMRVGKLDVTYECIEHGYKELTMPPSTIPHHKGMGKREGEREGEGEENWLHLWPRGEFLLLGLPNQDRSFTLTLFMPFTVFESIKTHQDLLSFFRQHFPDALSRVGEERLVREFFDNPTSRLSSIKCQPHCLPESGALLLGDAAHAMVPFFGQGMNAGFEDCLLFDELLERSNDGNLATVAWEYSQSHWRDSHAIADLSMGNYVELRSHVNGHVFSLRRHVDNFLHRHLPGWFTPLYSMVAFSRTPYSQAVSRHRSQRKAVSLGMFAVGSGGCVGLLCSLLLCLYYISILWGASLNA